MKFSVKLLAAGLIVSMLTMGMVSCNDSENNAETTGGSVSQDGSGEGTSAVTGDSAAITDVTNFINNYYNELNNGNYEIILNVFSDDEKVLQSRISNFELMASMFTTKYEVLSVDADYTDDGSITATVITKITSTNVDSGVTNLMKEPSYYTLEAKGDSFVFTSYSAGESELIVETNIG